MPKTGTDPSVSTGAVSTFLPDVTLAEHQKTFTTNDSSFEYYDVWKYHCSELQPSPVRSEEKATTVDTYIGSSSSATNNFQPSKGVLREATMEVNVVPHPQNAVQITLNQNSTTDDKLIVYNVSTSSMVVPNCKGKIQQLLVNQAFRDITQGETQKSISLLQLPFRERLSTFLRQKEENCHDSKIRNCPWLLMQ